MSNIERVRHQASRHSHGADPSAPANPHARLLIAGQLRDTATHGRSVDPATGEQIGTYAEAGQAEVDAAIDAAFTAFETTDWRQDRFGRVVALQRLADAFSGSADRLGATISSENGKLLRESQREVDHAERQLRLAAGLAATDYGRVMDPRIGQQSMSFRQPIGVAGIIVPWNAPVVLCVRALAPALAAGCTVVIKMPSQSAQTARVLADLVAGVPEIPAGVVNVLIESGSVVAQTLVSSPKVPTVSYTGSTKVGTQIAVDGAAHLKRLGLELGGKNPLLVFDDADLEKAVPIIVRASTQFAGQFCMTGSRVLVQRGVVDELRSALSDALTAVRLGPAADPESQMGPMIDQANVRRVDDLVSDAIAHGAEPIVRGGPVTDGPLAAGAFYRPTLLEVSDTSLDLVQDEVFGPVQTFEVFDSEADGIALANATSFGLSASIWTTDVNRPLRVARALEFGLVSINSWANLATEFEEGGWKSSGVGRLNGLASLDQFLEYKQITQDYVADVRRPV